MGTIARANASHGFGDDVFGFFLRDLLAGGVRFCKILPQFGHDFEFALLGTVAGSKVRTLTASPSSTPWPRSVSRTAF
jgi:hypothetical protein